MSTHTIAISDDTQAMPFDDEVTIAGFPGTYSFGIGTRYGHDDPEGAFVNRSAAVIAAYPIAPSRVYEVEIGDTIVMGSRRYTLTTEKVWWEPQPRPALVKEA